MWKDKKFVFLWKLQGGSNMTGTNCDLFTHNQSRSYLNHLVFWNRKRDTNNWKSKERLCNQSRHSCYCAMELCFPGVCKGCPLRTTKRRTTKPALWLFTKVSQSAVCSLALHIRVCFVTSRRRSFYRDFSKFSLWNTIFRLVAEFWKISGSITKFYFQLTQPYLYGFHLLLCRTFLNIRSFSWTKLFVKFHFVFVFIQPLCQ